MFPPDPPVETGKCQNGARRPRVRYAAPRRALACCAPFRRRRFTATGGSGGKTIQREFRVHGHYPESERACLPLVGPEEGANIGEGRLYLTNTGLLMEDAETLRTRSSHQFTTETRRNPKKDWDEFVGGSSSRDRGSGGHRVGRLRAALRGFMRPFG